MLAIFPLLNIPLISTEKQAMFITTKHLPNKEIEISMFKENDKRHGFCYNIDNLPYYQTHILYNVVQAGLSVTNSQLSSEILEVLAFDLINKVFEALEASILSPGLRMYMFPNTGNKHVVVVKIMQNMLTETLAFNIELAFIFGVEKEEIRDVWEKIPDNDVYESSISDEDLKSKRVLH